MGFSSRRHSGGGERGGDGKSTLRETFWDNPDTGEVLTAGTWLFRMKLYALFQFDTNYIKPPNTTTSLAQMRIYAKTTELHRHAQTRLHHHFIFLSLNYTASEHNSTITLTPKLKNAEVVTKCRSLGEARSPKASLLRCSTRMERSSLFLCPSPEVNLSPCLWP